jgi:tetratricopeptide (TPR) repeat protein
VDTTPAARIAQPEAGGSAITLETSEPLFYLAVALNACGYDAGLAESSPIRTGVRGEINNELAASAPARDARDALCTFIRLHALADPGRDIAQYISLALYLSPPPELAPTVDETDLPPDSTQVVGVLPLVRSFAEAMHLQALWSEHRPEYEGLVDRIHDPLTKMVLDTNVYLRLPISNYDGRRLLVLLEPMLAPTETNARIYANDYVVVVSPAAQPPDSVRMDLVRHIYLQFLIEPLIHARSSAMDRLQPLLKPVQQAPLEFTYKSDVASLLTECVIKAVEAQTMDVGIPRPPKPAIKDRSDQERYESEMIAYDRQAEAVRQKRVELDMRQGWVLVDYFYNQLGTMQREGSSLKDKIGPMVYGMDVDRQVHQAGQIVFLPEGSEDTLVRRAPRQVTGLDLAEMKLMQGDIDGAEEIAVAALEKDATNAPAHYLLGRIDLMQHDADGAVEHFTKTVQLSHDPRSIAWAHIYLGRIYDIEQPPERDKAVAEYKAALASRDSQPDTKAAAELGIKEAFVAKGAPARRDDSEELDPTGKAEKESYRPTPPQ